MAQSPAAPDPTGEWRVDKGYATIRLVDCSGEIWGIVASEQTPGIDKNNPDPQLRSRPTLGMPILLGMKQAEQNKWSGEIYNSQDGRTYSANISLSSPDVLKVQGCVLGFLCGGENWTRIQPDKTSAPAANKTASAPHPIPTPRPPATKPAAGRGVPTTTGSTPPNPQTQPAEEICSALVGLPGGAHERRLK